MDLSDFGPIISQYTRKDAIADELVFDFSDRFRDEWQSLSFQYPVYVSREVWFGLIVEPADHQRCRPCFLAELLMIALKQAIVNRGSKQEAQIEMEHGVLGNDRAADWERDDGFPMYRLGARLEAKDLDNPDPCIYVGFPNED